ncbi:fer-1-like protein 4 [Myxocyprinus asiaticus]|uniref:fer-1-like protein 4 n=1 Tax=Myxocyprinus asiaticus TaxID=70543 RepID=UPI002222D6E7|nr:fer-1-like protein 4 [Myxocyprinus asiaticus]
MEQRTFGRLVLVGTHMVQSLVQLCSRDQEEWKDEEEEPEENKPTKKTTPLSTGITMDLEGLPLKDTKISPKCIALNLVTAPIKKMTKKEEELEEEEPEKEELDWWSKYYATLAELEKNLRNY